MKKTTFIILIIILFFFLFVHNDILAGSKGGTGEGGTVKLDNPLGETDVSPQQLIGKIINAVLGIVGSLALVMFIYGGFIWMMAGGNAEAVTKGKNVLVWATIGLIVIFTSYALVHFIIFEGLGAG